MPIENPSDVKVRHTFVPVSGSWVAEDGGPLVREDVRGWPMPHDKHSYLYGEFIVPPDFMAGFPLSQSFTIKAWARGGTDTPGPADWAHIQVDAYWGGNYEAYNTHQYANLAITTVVPDPDRNHSILSLSIEQPAFGGLSPGDVISLVAWRDHDHANDNWPHPYYFLGWEFVYRVRGD